MDSLGFTDCTLKITPLANASKEHDQPNCPWKGSKQKNKKQQNKYTGSVKSKRNRTESDYQKCRHLTWRQVTKKIRTVVLWYHNCSKKKKDARSGGAGGCRHAQGRLFRSHFVFLKFTYQHLHLLLAFAWGSGLCPVWKCRSFCYMI